MAAALGQFIQEEHAIVGQRHFTRQLTPPICCVGDQPSSFIRVIQALLKIARIVEQL
jgi:hypothetical protein